MCFSLRLLLADRSVRSGVYAADLVWKWSGDAETTFTFLPACAHGLMCDASWARVLKGSLISPAGGPFETICMPGDLRSCLPPASLGHSDWSSVYPVVCMQEVAYF